MNKKIFFLFLLGILFVGAGILFSFLATPETKEPTQITPSPAQKAEYRVFREMAGDITTYNTKTIKTTLQTNIIYPGVLPVFSYARSPAGRPSLPVFAALGGNLGFSSTISASVQGGSFLGTYEENGAQLSINTTGDVVSFTYFSPQKPIILTKGAIADWLGAFFSSVTSVAGSYSFVVSQNVQKDEGFYVEDLSSLPVVFYSYSATIQGYPLVLGSVGSSGGVVGIDKNGYVRYFSGFVPPSYTSAGTKKTISNKDISSVIKSGGGQLIFLQAGMDKSTINTLTNLVVNSSKVVYVPMNNTSLLVPALLLGGTFSGEKINYLLWLSAPTTTPGP